MTDITSTAGNDLKNYTYNILKERLISCTYTPGSILSEAHLTSEMKLSHTPAREAVSRLEIEGFVRVIPKKGIHIANVLLNDVLQIFQIRTGSEPTILKLSASRLSKSELLRFIQRLKNPDPNDTVVDRIRLDTAIHLFIIEHRGDHYMVDIMHRVYDIGSRITFFIHQNHATVHGDSGENLEILRLLSGRDPETATKRMRVHMEHCWMATLNYFYTVPDGEAPVRTYRNKLYKKQETAPYPHG